jgi:hypothetical protein
VCGRAPASASQPFNQCAPDGARETFAEALTWQWYLTAGAIDDAGDIGNAVGDHVRIARPTGPFTLWAVLRDGRGGVTWVERRLPAVP